MAVKLKSNGEVLLDGMENLGTFVLDHAGGIALDHQVIRKVITSLVRALNGEHDAVATMQEEMDELHGEVYSLKESSSGFTTSLAGQAEELSDVKMELSKVSIRLGELIKTTKKQQEEACSESVVKKLREDFEAMQEQHHLLAERFEVTERAQQEDSDKFDRQIKDCNQHLERHSTTIEQDINAHLHELDDTLLSLKLDVESVQGSLTEANKSKASRAELAEMQKTLKAVLEEVEADHSTLEEAAANLGKLEMCISMAAENKSRTEELWRIFRGETQELRDWTSRHVGEMRDQIQQKLEKSIGMAHIEELQNDVRIKMAQLAEAAARSEASVQLKADVGDVMRLQHAMRDVRARTERQTQRLLIGTRCIACDRVLPEERVGDDRAVDNASLFQQEELWREVQKVLAEKSGANPGLANDVLKLVAVRVGSPRRTGTIGGLGPVSVRDGSDDDNAHQLMSSAGSPRPLRKPQDHGELPARSPAREAAPLVRMMPKRPQGFEASRAPSAPAQGASHGFSSYRRNPATTHSSVRAALGQAPNSGQRTPRVLDGASPPPPQQHMPSPPEGNADGRGRRTSGAGFGSDEGREGAWEEVRDGSKQTMAKLPTLTQPSAAGQTL